MTTKIRITTILYMRRIDQGRRREFKHVIYQQIIVLYSECSHSKSCCGTSLARTTCFSYFYTSLAPFSSYRLPLEFGQPCSTLHLPAFLPSAKSQSLYAVEMEPFFDSRLSKGKAAKLLKTELFLQTAGLLGMRYPCLDY